MDETDEDKLRSSRIIEIPDERRIKHVDVRSDDGKCVRRGLHRLQRGSAELSPRPSLVQHC